MAISKMDRLTDLFYRLLSGLITILVSFAIGWFVSSQYTMKTLEVWYQPETDSILVMDYFGNIDAHYFNHF